MERRKFLIGAGSLAAGGAAALGSGAFTSVSANRSVSVSVAEDSSAFLTLTQSGTGPNSQYASVSDGQVTVNLDNSDDGGGAGLNKDAETDIFDIFRVRNEGTQPVFVYVDPNSVTPEGISGDPDGDGDNEYGDAPGIYIDPQASGRPNAVNFTDGRGAISATGIYGVFDPTTGFADTNTFDAQDLTLDVGESLNFGLFINTTGADSVSFDASMDIVADADLAANI